ncbi:MULTISPECIES: alternative ribosome rescue aminoacyl-tRNA hydrolase ArfB [Actinopolyspora]|uniref:Ribosome-associated protein n=1 Tax=Actinopolyspora saharensis TaxID=995062 RepID=A0A1H1DZS8_9ACTN|nr:alternative ribosome rescue aminoacyl-tRNA hydrolase ArfB [Actinopolyspora saharensis]NHD18704.1 aminoacyl-tRNA hydrolase [Actinopolyspora sp. BKK2]NHE77974.1 aminoacyl-tRNA hydrolase [Actinopolyspora sp. BKK1]SDQ81386.1 ribosome-associated protein [Actinopolyspora saharensis]
MPEDLRVNRRVTIPASELVERFSRSSGPGGQHVNTTETRVELSVDLRGSRALTEQQREHALSRLSGRLSGGGVLTVAADRERSQVANRKQARLRLAEMLAEALRPAPQPRRRSGPSAGAKRRRLEDKRHRSKVKRTRGKGPPERE